MNFFKKLFPIVLLLSACEPAHALLSDRDKAELGVERNYLTNGGCESSTAGYSAFHTSFSGGLPGSITLGSTKLSVVAVGSNVLEGQASCEMLVTTAASSDGHGIITDPITIKDADLGKVLATQFDYNFVSGIDNVDVSGTSTQTVEVWIYNVGLGIWYQPAGFRSIDTKGANSQFVPGRTPTITWQSDISNSSNKNIYRVAWIIRNAPAGTFAMVFDNTVFGRPTRNTGPAVDDLVAYTPTIVGFDSTSNVNFVWRKIGDSEYIQGKFTTGAGNASTVTISLPSGTIDSDKLPGLSVVGQLEDSVSEGAVLDILAVGGTSVLNMGAHSTGNAGGLTARNGTFMGGTRDFAFTALVPIQGWSSSVKLSSDTDTRVVAATYTTVTAQSIPNSATKVQFNTKVLDTHNAFDPVTDYRYTIPVSGIYHIYGALTESGTTAASYIFAYLYVNGVNVETNISSNYDGGGAYNPGLTYSFQRPLKAGDYVEIFGQFEAGGTLDTNTPPRTTFNISRLSGPSVIAANETVAATYTGAPPTGTINGSTNAITYGTKVLDTHSAYSGNTLTIPVSGTYSFSATFLCTGTYVLNDTAVVSVFKNGAVIASNAVRAGGAVSYTQPLVSVANWPFIAGDTVVVKSYCDATGAAFGSGAETNIFSITRVGN